MNNRAEYALANGLSDIDQWTQTARSARAARAARRRDFDPGERQRRAAQIGFMIAEMEKAAVELDREIEAEQARSRIHDPAHFAYPTYAKAATLRRDNLRRSIDKLREYI
jgi:flagellar protein FliJ